MAPADMPKFTKQETDYSRGHADSHCGKVFADDKGYCKHFQRNGAALGKGTCSLVDGEIDPIFWCTKWQRSKQ